MHGVAPPGHHLSIHHRASVRFLRTDVPAPIPGLSLTCAGSPHPIPPFLLAEQEEADTFVQLTLHDPTRGSSSDTVSRGG